MNLESSYKGKSKIEPKEQTIDVDLTLGYTILQNSQKELDFLLHNNINL